MALYHQWYMSATVRKKIKKILQTCFGTSLLQIFKAGLFKNQNQYLMAILGYSYLVYPPYLDLV